MGGNAIRSLGLEARRVTTQEHNDIVIEVKARTAHLFDTCEPVKFYHQKADHGDVDIVCAIKGGADTKNPLLECPEANLKPRWIDLLTQTLESRGVLWNPPVASMELRGVQVDFSGHPDPVMAQTHLDFSHYSPTGNVIGRMIKQTGAKWGVDGLTFPMRENLAGNGNILGIIRLSFEAKDAFELAGIPADAWRRGFETQEDIFSWASNSALFNKDIFDFENLDHTNRKRDALRPDYHTWRAFIENLPPKYKRSENDSERTQAKTRWFEILCETFPNLRPEREKILEEKKEKAIHREKLKGNLIQQWTGLQGQALGNLIRAFRAHGVPGGMDYDRWLATISASEAKSTFLEFSRKNTYCDVLFES